LAGEFQTGNVPNFKALLPVHSRPIADYVIQALEQSNVEKIFVMQDEDAALQEALTPSSKCIFFTKDKDHSSLGMGSLFALEKIAEYYGNAELNKRSIMIVPCDTPLVTNDHFNRLINTAASKNADVTITIIAAEHLERQYPQRRFRSVYLADYKTKYTLQNVIFVDGEFIRFKPSEDPGKLNFYFKGWDDDVLKRVKDGIDSIDALRHQSFFHNRLFLLWLLTKGYTSYIFKLLVNLAFKRLTMAKVIEYLNGADHMQAAYIESQEVELSADIDRPEDFQIVLGIPWQSFE
jgi:GTP:adenosylcobinamide-phosphate guanylyltransferase